jgi:hypothetical protein
VPNAFQFDKRNGSMRMNSIVVVGHPKSDFQDIQELLLQSGVGEARPSSPGSYTPAQISEILLKAHGATPVHEIRTDEPISQIDVSPVWHGLNTDVVLANVDQDLWGWADTQAVYLLDYLAAIDSRILFLLAYNEPKSVYTNAAFECLSATDGELEGWLRGWVAYNSALLKFHLRHPTRSILVHGGQAKISTLHWLHQIQGMLCSSAQATPTLQLPETLCCSSQRPNLFAARASHAPICGDDRLADRQAMLDDPTLLELIAGDMVEACPRSIQLYEELQAAASLPADASLEHRTTLDGEGLPVRYRAWRTLFAQKAALRDHVMLLASRDSEITTLNGEIGNKNAAIEELRSEQSALANRLKSEQTARAKLEKEYAAQGKEVETLKKEKERLREETQATLGSEIACQKVANEKLQSEQSALTSLVKKEQSTRTKLEKEATERGKELQSLQKEKQRLLEENQLLLAQFHQAQEELERHQLASQPTKQDKAPSAAQVFGAANRVKQQLSYRLGARMIEQPAGFRGTLTLPVALVREVRQFRKDSPASELAKLPPIEAYADAKDAERIKRHLSYRLGTILLAHSKNPVKWASLPWALRREVKRFEQERRTKSTSTDWK